MALVRIADYIASFLEEQGVEDIFLVTGGGSIFLCDALYDSKKIKYHPCHNEQSVTMAAEGYARAKNDIGVACVTTGPGCTNAITGVAGAWTDSVPMLVLSGQVFLNQTIGKTGLRQYGVQEINIIDLIKPVTKYSVMIEDPKMVKYHLQKAIYLAKSGRPGPTWLDIPANIQMGKIDPKDFVEFKSDEIKLDVDPDLKEKVTQVVAKLKTANRPMFHAGQGVKIARAENDFFNIIEKKKIPFVTARNANDMVETSHELFVGRPGTFAQRGANFAVQNSDFYLTVGARMSFTQTGYNSKDFARNAFKVMVDIDRAELNKPSLDFQLKICADAKTFLQELNRQLERERFDFSTWIKQCQQWKAKYPVLIPEQINQKDTVSSYYFVDQLSEIASSEDIVVTDMGFSFQCTHQAFKVKKGQKLFTNSGFAAMGWGLPAAIGACFAMKRRTICLTGDGGFMMNPQELAVVMHNKLPIKIFLFNNGGYLTQKQSQEAGFNGRVVGANPETGVGFPNFEKYAGAHDIAYVKISNHQNLKENLSKVLNMPGPVFCELMMDHNEVQGPRCANRILPDGTKVQSGMEDMFPFLDPKEIEENMSYSKK